MTLKTRLIIARTLMIMIVIFISWSIIHPLLFVSLAIGMQKSQEVGGSPIYDIDYTKIVLTALFSVSAWSLLRLVKQNDSSHKDTAKAIKESHDTIMAVLNPLVAEFNQLKGAHDQAMKDNLHNNE